MARRPKPPTGIDTELSDLPVEMRWREWMGRAEAVIFASPVPVTREMLARVVGRTCSIDALIADIKNDLHGRPYDLVAVAGGWQHRTRMAYADAIKLATRAGERTLSLSKSETLVLTAIAYLQPITRGQLSKVFGREISRDTIADLRASGMVSAGPRSPTPGAPYTYVTTSGFLSQFGFESLRDLPDMEQLEDAGLLNKATLLSDAVFGPKADEDEDAESPEEREDALSNT